LDAGSANVTESAAAAARGARRRVDDDEDNEEEGREGRGGANTADEAEASTALIADSVKTIAVADVVVAVVVDMGVSPCCGEITVAALFALILDIGD